MSDPSPREEDPDPAETSRLLRQVVGMHASLTTMRDLPLLLEIVRGIVRPGAKALAIFPPDANWFATWNKNLLMWDFMADG